MGADVDPNALPEDWVETKVVKGQELAGPMPDGVSPLMGKDQEVKTPKKFVEYGDYVAPLDFGGVEAAKQAQLAKQADWLPIQSDVTIAGQTFKAGTRVPPAIWALAGKETAPPKTENIGGRLKGYNAKTGMFDIDYGPAGNPKTGETTGGAYKAVYDKTKKEDVMANDAMIAKNPENYGPAKKGDGGGDSFSADVEHLAKGGTLATIPKARQTAAAKAAREAGVIVFETPKQKAGYETTTQSLDEAEELSRLLTDPDVAGAFGTIAGRWSQSRTTGWASLLPGQVSPNVRRAVQIAQNLNDLRLRQRSGAAISEAEAKRLGRFSFDPTVPTEQMKVNIQPFIKELQAIQRGYAGGMSENPKGNGNDSLGVLN
jgi:hypothetical protein